MYRINKIVNKIEIVYLNVSKHISSSTPNLSRMLFKQLQQQSRIFIAKMSIFTQSFDPITGCASWEEKNPDYDYHQEVARSAFADMLHDHERNEKYYLALRQAIEKKHRAGDKANVLDIGTGTGLLSMMAAKCGADTVTACEAFRPMADCAKKILKENGFDSRIKLVRKRSTEMTVGETGDMKHRANILVTEVFDTELIGEGALSTFKHAHDTLLEEDCIVIPNRATVYAQVIESNNVRSWNRINIIEDPKTGEKLITPPCAVDKCCGSSAVHDIQLSQLPQDTFKSLLHPQPIFTFNWSNKDSLVFVECQTLFSNAIASGTAHAIFMWWELVMDHDEEIILSCAPIWDHPGVKSSINGLSLSKTTNVKNEIPWRDHWMQAVYYLPEELSITDGERIALIGYHDEYSFWFQVKKSLEGAPMKRSACVCTTHLAYSRTRIGQLNNKARNEKYIETFRNVIKSGTICFSFSDGSLLGLAAAKLGAKKVIILESNYLSQRTLENFIVTNNLTSTVEIVKSVNQIDFDHVKADLVIGEPYYVHSIYPWDNLRFWYLTSKYTPGIPTIPMAARIRGIAVEFDHLHKIRAPLGICEGFDLTTFDKLVLDSSEISDNPVEVHSLWEYPANALTNPFDIAHFEFSQKFENSKKTIFSGQEPISASGSCNGVALWIDWYLDSKTIVSGGPLIEVEPGKNISWEPNVRQGVFLLRNIENVEKRHILSWSLECHFGEVQNLNFTFKLDVKS